MHQRLTLLMRQGLSLAEARALPYDVVLIMEANAEYEQEQQSYRDEIEHLRTIQADKEGARKITESIKSLRRQAKAAEQRFYAPVPREVRA